MYLSRPINVTRTAESKVVHLLRYLKDCRLSHLSESNCDPIEIKGSFANDFSGTRIWLCMFPFLCWILKQKPWWKNQKWSTVQTSNFLSCIKYSFLINLIICYTTLPSKLFHKFYDALFLWKIKFSFSYMLEELLGFCDINYNQTEFLIKKKNHKSKSTVFALFQSYSDTGFKWEGKFDKDHNLWPGCTKDFIFLIDLLCSLGLFGFGNNKQNTLTTWKFSSFLMN